MDDGAKTLFSLIPGVGAILEYVRVISDRLHWISAADRLVPRASGHVVAKTDRYSQTVAIGVVGLLTFAALFAFTAGVMKFAGVDTPGILNWFFDRAWIWIVSFVLVTVLVHWNVPAKLAVRAQSLFSSEAKYDPRWINANWHTRLDSTALAIGLDKTVVDRITAIVIQARRTDNNVSSHEAVRPESATPAERANVLLFATAYEHVAVDLQDQPESWKDFYITLSKVKDLFSPDFVKSTGNYPEGFFEVVATSFDNESASYKLANRKVASRRINQLFEKLRNSHQSSALSLGKDESSYTRVGANVSKFSEFEHEPTKHVFLKLALRWGLWPNIAPSPVIFPFSKNILCYFLNEGLLVPPGDAESISIDENLENITRYAEKLIADRVDDVIGKSNQQEDRDLFANANSIVEAVDYLIWYLAKNRDKQPWKIGAGNRVIKD